MEKFKLGDIDLFGNYLIVKPDPNYDFLTVPGADGIVKLYLGYLPQDETKHVSISGTILKATDELKYYRKVLVSKKGEDVSHEEFSALMRNSMPYETSMNVKVGDKVYFDYHNQFDVELEGRVLEIEDYGICMLMSYETFFGKEQDGEFVPLNGYVIFKRDQKEREYVTASGLTVIENVDVYAGKSAQVVSADHALTGYLDKSYEDQVKLKKGDRILINPNFGFRMSYSLHDKEIEDYEVIRRKHILGVFQEN